MASSNPAPSDTITSTSPAGAADMMMPITITHLVMIAIAVVLTILMIWWGQRRWKQSKAAQDDIQARGNTVEVGGGALPDAAPVRDEVAVRDEAPMPVVQPAPDPTPPAAPLATPAPFTATAPDAPPPPVPAQASTPEPAAASTPAGGELTLLKGLGPKAATMLAEQGITDIAALAALSDEQAAALDRELGPFSGRMSRDRWHEQARLLTAGERDRYEAMFGKIG
ncbi:hypothetical protein [Sphingomonas sp. IW22]|uniref:hypothetical protein n=1 Tax=Sphingomonas sp. IW22 TaxID=3242489 RepID=UPI0035202949